MGPHIPEEAEQHRHTNIEIAKVAYVRVTLTCDASSNLDGKRKKWSSYQGRNELLNSDFELT